MIQGIIDAYLEEEDGLVLIDYKTDYILQGQEEILIKRYKAQLDYYGRALEQIIDLGCDRLLTSGQQPAAEQGAKLIAELVRQADGRIIVMPGAGIRPSNIADIERITRAEEFHSTARSSAPDGMSYRNPDVSFAVEADETIVRRTDRRVVSQLVNDAV